uniref:thioredoxin-dependent peroxiredoxin n=1 Tax=Oryzias melastigma TaxID=30732 RepID=A0A3B3CQK2_ORYME
MESCLPCTLKEFLCALLAALLLLGTVASAEEGKNSQCHNYAGGHVYPGEAFRVPVSDHSLHLSKAKISKPAPHWEGTAVINGEFKELKLSDYKGKYLVFFFYPLDFTFVCPTEIIAFSDRVHEFQAINTEVVACSVDSQFTHLAWCVYYLLYCLRKKKVSLVIKLSLLFVVLFLCIKTHFFPLHRSFLTLQAS